jgi:hypothetical protein
MPLHRVLKPWRATPTMRFVKRAFKRPERVWWHVEGEAPDPERVGWLEHFDGNVCYVAPGVGEPTIRVWIGHVHGADEQPPVEGCAFCHTT